MFLLGTRPSHEIPTVSFCNIKKFMGISQFQINFQQIYFLWILSLSKRECDLMHYYVSGHLHTNYTLEEFGPFCFNKVLEEKLYVTWGINETFIRRIQEVDIHLIPDMGVEDAVVEQTKYHWQHITFFTWTRVLFS